MVAQVFSFLKAKTKIAAAADWSSQEIAEFYRVEASLIQSGMAVSGDRGVTDEGDPWFVFCRSADGEVIIHFARLGGDYLIVSQSTGQNLRGPDFRRLLTEFSAINPTLVSLRKAETSAKLFIHPAALLAAIVAGAFFHFSGLEAVAGEINADSRDEQPSSHRAVSLHGETRLLHVSDVAVAPDRHQTDRQVVAAMAAMIGLAAFESAPVGGGAATGLANFLLDVSADTFDQPKIDISHFAVEDYDASRASSDHPFSLSLTSPSVYSTPIVTDSSVSQQINHFNASARHPDGFVESVTRVTPVTGPEHRLDMPIPAFTNAGSSQFIAPVAKFADSRARTASLDGAGAVSPSQASSAANDASVIPNHASTADNPAQPFLKTAIDIISSDVTATSRSVTVTSLRADMTLPNVLEYAANQTFGHGSPVNVASLIDLSFNSDSAKVDVGAIGTTVSVLTGSALSAATTSGTSSASTTSTAYFAGATRDASIVAHATPDNTATTPQSAATTHFEFPSFDASAESLLRSFITANQTEIFTTGKNVVVIDIENHHQFVNDIVIKSWSTTDGSTISIIGHSADMGLALM